ncbi:hypothetical protein Glove_126g7 [Diversispora epigaea]|uniref:HMG box domain-containing protein n=1 Tax=Diversispora epigaea TaxID=1348612 RepID=A0A397J2W9_9GLOM|nr:hypothetical protein Glove_126g7 [Diversispora epigaea]
MPKSKKSNTKVDRPTRQKRQKGEGEGGSETIKKEIKNRKEKDSSEPKRNLSAYIYFSRDYREKTKAEHPNATFADIGKLLGERWRNMSENEKIPYKELAARDKKRYENEKAAQETTVA